MKLKNATGARSRLGLTVILDPKNPSAFVYSVPDATNIIGIVGEEVRNNDLCEIITSGVAKVLVSDLAIQGSVIRAQKSTDRISRGFCKTAKSTDTPYFQIGTAIETGRGLVKCNLNLTGGSASEGYVPYVGAIDDVDIGDHVITSGGSHITSSDEFTYPAESALSQWWMDGVGGFFASRNWATLAYLDTFFEGANLYFGVYSDANSLFYGDAEFHETVKMGSGTDHVLVDGSGNMSFVGDATVWEDIRIVPNIFDVPGLTDPDIISYQPAGSGATFKVYAFAKGDEGFFTIQMPHSYKVGTTMYAHVHWTPGTRGNEENGNVVQWRLDYSFAAIDGNFPASQTLDLSDACDGTDHKHQMSPTVAISGVGLGISSQMFGRIYRYNHVSDTWAGTGANLPIFIEFDIHFEIDSVGSKTQTVK